MIVEGIGAGVYDTMLPIIVKKMTLGSGRFGFTFGFIVTCWRLGHGVSVFFGEAIVRSFGYTVVFIVLACLGLVNLLVFTFFYSPYSTTAEKKDGQSKVDVIKEEERENILANNIVANIADIRDHIAAAGSDEEKKVFEDAMALEGNALKSLKERQEESMCDLNKMIDEEAPVVVDDE
jgi:hypothetical protein